jgi:ABC-type multidrug transport system fused ATPase/permease subunit
MLIISSACSLAQPAFFGRIIAVCSSDNPRLKDINKYAVILIVIFAIGGITSCIRGWLFTLVGERLVRNIRIDLFNAIIEQDIAFFDRNKTGELANRLSSDTAVIQSCLSVNVSMGLRAVGSVVVSIIFLFVTSWELTLIMMGVVPVIVIIAIIYGRFTKRVTKEYQDSLAKANGRNVTYTFINNHKLIFC